MKATKATDVRIADALERIAAALELQCDLLKATTLHNYDQPFRRPDGTLSPRYLRALCIQD